NPAFAKHTGLPNPVGRTVGELIPDVGSAWAERYLKVLRTGEPARFHDHVPSLDRWFDVAAARIGGPGSRRVAVLFSDATDRQRADAALRASEERFRTIVQN